jgi:hypothetical protein
MKFEAHGTEEAEECCGASRVCRGCVAKNAEEILGTELQHRSGARWSDRHFAERLDHNGVGEGELDRR